MRCTCLYAFVVLLGLALVRVDCFPSKRYSSDAQALRSLLMQMALQEAADQDMSEAEYLYGRRPLVGLGDDTSDYSAVRAKRGRFDDLIAKLSKLSGSRSRGRALAFRFGTGGK